MRSIGSSRIFVSTLCAACLILLAPAAASAQAGTGSFELYGGYYSPEDEVIDDDLTFGARGVYSWTDALAFELTAGRFEDEERFDGGGRIDLEYTLVDLSAALSLNPGSPFELSIFGGPGWAFLDFSSRGFATFPPASSSDDSFTLHAGANLQISLSERIYLRPDVRARYFEESEDIDLEASIGLGIRIGR